MPEQDHYWSQSARWYEEDFIDPYRPDARNPLVHSPFRVPAFTARPSLHGFSADASLAGAAKSVPWLPLGQLFEAFANIHGVGFAKTTKALHPKRPALIPILDSVVQRYLESDDLGAQAPFGERALALVRGYKRDLDRNRAAVRAIKRELARRDYRVTEVRILDLLIWSVEATRER